MTIIGVLIIVFFLLVGWLLCLAYRKTEQDFPPLHRCHRNYSFRDGAARTL
jgi:hypothetical protein